MNAIAQASAAPVTGPKLDNRRVLAGIVDLLIVAVGAAVVLFAGDALSGDGSDVRGALGAVILGWSLYYYFALESGDGQTVGKKLMKLRVVRTDGSPVGMREVAVRTVLRVVDGIGAYIVGLIVMLATGERRRRLGDLAAGTMVVDASRPSVSAAAPPPVAEPVAEEAEPMPEPEPMPELTSPSLEELAHDVEVARAEPAPAAAEVAEPVEEEAAVEPAEVDQPAGVDQPAEVDQPAGDDGPVTVKSVETVSAIDLVMGGADERDPSSEDSSESPQGNGDSASR